jgi:translation initiation factor IF-1
MDVFAWLTDTNKSFVVAAVAALASSVFLGCSSSPTPADASIEKPDSISVGQRYLISTCSESPVKSSVTKFTGRVTEVNVDGIVMVDPHVEVSIEDKWPMVGKIPGNHPFKNSKWVAGEKRIGNVTIDRGDIVTIEPADAGG